MRAEELLILNFGDFSGRVRELFRNMSQSRSFRELFLADPAGVIHRAVFPPHIQPPPAEINQANRLLFALLSNKGFMDWSVEFQTSIEARLNELAKEEQPQEAVNTLVATLDRSVLYRQIIDGIRQHADLETWYALSIVDRPVSADPVEPPTRPPLPKPGPGPDPSPDLGVAGSYRLADVTVEIEIAIYAIAVAAVFVVVLMVVFAGRAPTPPEGISRVDLERITRLLVQQLPERAQEIRESGKLRSIDAARLGPRL